MGRKPGGTRQNFCTIKVYDKIVELASSDRKANVSSKWARLLGADCAIQPALKEKLDECIDTGMTRLEVSLSPLAISLVENREAVSSFMEDIVSILNRPSLRRAVKCCVPAGAILRELAALKKCTLVLNGDQAILVLAKSEFYGKFIGTTKLVRSKSELLAFAQQYATPDCEIEVFAVTQEEKLLTAQKKGPFMAPGVNLPSFLDGQYWESKIPNLTFDQEKTQEATVTGLDRISVRRNRVDEN